MMVPAVDDAWLLLAGVLGAFTLFTVGSMLAAVALGYVGLTRARLGGFERRIDVLAELTVAAGGAAVLWLGVWTGLGPAPHAVAPRSPLGAPLRACGARIVRARRCFCRPAWVRWACYAPWAILSGITRTPFVF